MSAGGPGRTGLAALRGLVDVIDDGLIVLVAARRAVTAAIGTGPTDIVFVDVHPDPAVEPPVANYHWENDEAPKETQQVACLAAKVMLNVCEVHSYAGSGHSSKVGMADWPAFLYKWVIQKTPVPLALRQGLAPPLPSVHIPSKIVPTLPEPSSSDATMTVPSKSPMNMARVMSSAMIVLSPVTSSPMTSSSMVPEPVTVS